MKIESLKEVAQFRINKNTDTYWVEDFWNAAVDIFVKDIESTIEYFKNDCDDEEFFWLSEIFSDIVEYTQSKELIAVLRKRLEEVNENRFKKYKFKSDHIKNFIDYEEYVESIKEEIDFAENMIK